MADHAHGVAGHVALHQRSSDAVMAVASKARGEPAHRLGVVARLLVDPGFRGRGIGRALLTVAAGEAFGRGLWPVLDVSVRFCAAIQLYESCGWVCAGRVTARFPDGNELEEFVYIAPSGTAVTEAVAR